MAISRGTGLRAAWILGSGGMGSGACGALSCRRPNRRQHQRHRRISEQLPTPDRSAGSLGQPRTERLYRRTAAPCDSAQTVQADKDEHPMDISHADPYADMQIANSLAQRVEHVDRFQGWQW